ncbi:MAG: NADH-quinone oxidoreductase subunit L [Candidatus Tectomicrobia bacterium]|nr:NADH-quinone oxidoreductase subunit L [Candidatus Tectomicrobia bacterium]
MIEWVWLIPALPAAGVIINGLLGNRYIKERAHYVGVGSTALSLLVALFVIGAAIKNPGPHNVRLFDWVVAGSLHVDVAFLVDPLSAVMLFVVCGVGFLVHVYSIGYMRGDPGYPRFFTWLNLFMFSMLLLILGNNYLLMFVGWEGVGLCSYLLIGYWFERKSASDAANKAFIVNRIGDAGFLLGIFLIFKTFGSLAYAQVFAAAPGALSTGVATAIGIALFIGAVGKSAQLPLYVWLPDAMEGPTPVSALIHAATMVTAGVYMVARSAVIYNLAPDALLVVAVVGALTAIFAASIGLVQNDIKRVLAYSTVSQLGYMFLALGVGAYISGIFHLMTHAFFKGLLFLGSGSVIHAMSGEQDMRRMGALRKHIPITAITFYIGALAISGIPPFAGFWSKDEILAEAFKSGHYVLWIIGVATALMTAFYMFRLIYLTFYGASRVAEHAAHHLHESPPSMTAPLVILAGLSIIGGAIPGFPPEKGMFHAFLSQVPGMAPAGGGHAGLVGTALAAQEGAQAAHELSSAMHWFLILLSVAVAVAGWALAKHFYVRRPHLPERLARRFGGLYRLLLNKYWVDEIYDAVIVNPCKRFATFLWNFDAWVIDGIVNATSRLTVLNADFSAFFDRYTVDGAVNGLASVLQGWAGVFRRLQTGFVQNYALAMLLGIFAIVSLYLFV